MNQKSRELQESGVDVINLTLGEPDFNTPEHIKQAGIKAINDNMSHYPPVAGFPALKKAIADKLARDNNMAYSPDQIVVSAGAKHSLANVLQCVVNNGDEVIIPAPYWVSYIELVKLAEGVPVIVEAGVEAKFKITAEQLEESITPKTKAILFNSPSNPTGSVYSLEELNAIAAVLERHPDIIIISDEIYEKINFVGQHAGLGQFDALKEQTVIINGVSKGYAMTGWRIGYIAAPKAIAKAVTKLQGQYTSGVCAIAQAASIQAFVGDQQCVEEMRVAFNKRRDLVLDIVKDIPDFKVATPDGAFYIFPDISLYFGKSVGDRVINSSMDMSMYLLEKAHVASVPGSAFGSENCVRFSYAAADELLIKAFGRVKEALAQLK
ncbi:pyridoxal phosphate-dependent aminotransferase [Carboxylicivirga sp. M1479]|uniref:pyridoxal phosphate-dependent aminotransferase n=1 Tax=Carboxylicivirga sp. M1479 TaxID=2594476 RepID=UPI001C8F58A6|nr:pyridoxal phosphate-dependent aminotransferase [Carboxylicivirga sp. M1479]